jgi:peptidoglycan/LPS O-acetylase OafA/YrhL
VFFVLSGFLISRLLFSEHAKTGTVRIGRFLIRRGFKIYPAFWALIAVSAAFMAWNGTLRAADLAGELLFIQNYYHAMWNHTWSLAVEEHFYLGLSLLVVLLLRRDRSRPFAAIPLIFFVVAVGCFGLRAAAWAHHPINLGSRDTFPTHLRVDALFFGVYLSYLVRFTDFSSRLAAVPASLLLMGGSALLAPAFIYSFEPHRWGAAAWYSVFYVGAGLLLLGVLRLSRPKKGIVHILGALGGASYSIYLWHMPIEQLSVGILSRFNSPTFGFLSYLGVYVSVSLAFGWIIAQMIEMPILALRDRYWPSYSSAASPVVSGSLSAVHELAP